MEETKESRSLLKRSLVEDSESNQPPEQKRPRFPKGKKVKKGDEITTVDITNENELKDYTNPKFAAKERAKRRSQFTTELFSEQSTEILKDVSAAEENYEDNENFEYDGIQIEPFNLKQEREEGYFDAEGNFVEYATEREAKDAWLDSAVVDSRFAEKNAEKANKEEEIVELSSHDIGKIKRRIANLLQPGETVLQAFRRLKGVSHNRKEKMPAEIKLTFDQLTEDSMKLMENGEYNVFHDKQEVFEREAEGYEQLIHAREGSSRNHDNGYHDREKEDNVSTKMDPISDFPSILNKNTIPTSTGPLSGDGGDAFDMFGDDDEMPESNPSFQSHTVFENYSDQLPQTSSESIMSQGQDVANDYVLDETSGYYYSSSSGYYYDPTSGCYCCATTGKWYSFNEETGAYDEIKEDIATT